QQGGEGDPRQSHGGAGSEVRGARAGGCEAKRVECAHGEVSLPSARIPTQASNDCDDGHPRRETPKTTGLTFTFYSPTLYLTRGASTAPGRVPGRPLTGRHAAAAGNPERTDHADSAAAGRVRLHR